MSATGYTGSGLNLCGKQRLAEIMGRCFCCWQRFCIKPIGLGARDTLRLEMGFALYGNDISDTTSPIEAGLGWITKPKKETSIRWKFFKNNAFEGVSRKLVGFEVKDRRLPRHDYIIEDVNGNEIGVVTSYTPVALRWINPSAWVTWQRLLQRKGRRSESWSGRRVWKQWW
ncbi:MAG: hypothetical protein R2788_24680 [Saprospiraceae bacterium]